VRLKQGKIRRNGDIRQGSCIHRRNTIHRRMSFIAECHSSQQLHFSQKWPSSPLQHPAKALLNAYLKTRRIATSDDHNIQKLLLE
jgi:hypothetical protein